MDQLQSYMGLYVFVCDPCTSHRLPLVTCRNIYSCSSIFSLLLPPPPCSHSNLVQSRLMVLALLKCRTQGEMKQIFSQVYSDSSCWVYSLGFRCTLLYLAGKSTMEGGKKKKEKRKAAEASMKGNKEVEGKESVVR